MKVFCQHCRGVGRSKTSIEHCFRTLVTKVVGTVEVRNKEYYFFKLLVAVAWLRKIHTDV